MKKTLLLMWIGVACAQQPQAPARDIFNVNTPGQTGGTPLQAFASLYQVAAEMTGSPGSEYVPSHGPQSDFPHPTELQQQWLRAMAVNGNQLTTAERKEIIPCVAHLNTAIDSMERGYRIQITQKNNPPAQQSAQQLYARARAEFALCAGVDEFANNELKQLAPAGSPNGTGGSSGPPLQGGGSKGPGEQQSGPPGTGGSGQTNPSIPGNDGLPLPPGASSNLCESLGAPSWCSGSPSNPSQPGNPNQCACANPDNPAVCQATSSAARTFCIRGYTADEMLCGDQQSFTKGSLIHSRSSKLPLQEWGTSFPEEKQEFLGEVDSLVRTHFKYPPQWTASLRRFPFGLQVKLKITFARSSNGTSEVTAVVDAGHKTARIVRNPSDQSKYIFHSTNAPLDEREFTSLFVQPAITAGCSLNGSNGQSQVPFPDHLADTPWDYYLTLKNFDSNAFPGLPTVIPDPNRPRVPER